MYQQRNSSEPKWTRGIMPSFEIATVPEVVVHTRASSSMATAYGLTVSGPPEPP